MRATIFLDESVEFRPREDDDSLVNVTVSGDLVDVVDRSEASTPLGRMRIRRRVRADRLSHAISCAQPCLGSARVVTSFSAWWIIAIACG